METNITPSPAAELVLSPEANSIPPYGAIVNPSPAPVTKADRLQTVDLIRGFALLGILLMNIPGFGIDNSIYYQLLTHPTGRADTVALTGMMVFFEGTMRGLFSMLFGAGMILFTMNKQESAGGATVAEYYYRRLLWLVLFGLFNAFVLLWFGDILYYYGLCGMLLYAFRKTRPKWLILIGVACIVIPIIRGVVNYDEVRDKRAAYLQAVSAEKAHKKLSSKQSQDKNAWLEIEKNRKPDPEQTEKNVRKMHSNYSTIFMYFIPRNADDETWFLYLGAWDMLCMMFIGMGLFGLGFFSNRVRGSTYLMGLLAGYGVGIPVSWFYFKGMGLSVAGEWGNYVDTYRTPHWLLYDIKRVFLAVGHASLLMLVYRSRLLPWLMKALANVGQLAFTNYLMQSIICTWYFYGYGLGHYNQLRFHQLYYVVGCVWLFQLIFSSIWLRYFRFGPFEWLWRSLTYWKFQPMRI
ncbi:MAG: DUF418 domain-containing protein [Williamsia sp.]|nr:DUF418 domain-containing protein [Williamsia sp.]